MSTTLNRLGWGIGLTVVSFAASFGASAWADVVTLTPIKDNTLIEPMRKSINSNGLGDGIYAGKTGLFGNGKLLRAVLAFDVAGAIPEGSTINGASLTLTLVASVSLDQEHTLHMLLADWGEGTSTKIGGVGAPATRGDATWFHTFFPDALWTMPGGDFLPAVTASAMVGDVPGPIVWTSSQMSIDVQAWLDNPSTNFGWLMRGNEVVLTTAKKFASKDNRIVDDRPQLIIDFTPPPPACPTDITDDGSVNVDDLLAVINAWGACADPNDCPADVAPPPSGDDQVNVDDLLAIINAWGDCP